MPISVSCSCGKKYNVADKLVGKKFKCKACETVLAIRRPAARAKAKKTKMDEDSGFLDMDLDSEFSRMEAVEQPEYEEDFEDQDSPFLDARTRREPRVADLNKTDAELAAKYVPQPSGVEKTARVILGLAGIVLGIGMVVGTWYLWAKQGIRWRGLGAIGILFMIGGVKILADSD